MPLIEADMMEVRPVPGDEPRGPAREQQAPASSVEKSRRRAHTHLDRVSQRRFILRMVDTHLEAFRRRADRDSRGEHDTVVDFTRLVTRATEAELDEFVEELLRSGVAVDRLYLDLFVPAAQRLGHQWSDDVVNFVEVTLAAGRIQRLIRRLQRAFFAEAEPVANGHHLFLTCLPGEQHTLGMTMAEEFFTRAGWTVRLGSPYSGPGLETLRHQRFDAVGFSFVQPSAKLGLAKEIRRARSISLNNDLRVVVGGGAAPPFHDRPEALEADIVLTDLEEAPGRVAELIG